MEDAGNGASGFFAEEILAPLGADISGSVFLDPDGTFPNHVPNPEAMHLLVKYMRKYSRDCISWQDFTDNYIFV